MRDKRAMRFGIANLHGARHLSAAARASSRNSRLWARIARRSGRRRPRIGLSPRPRIWKIIALLGSRLRKSGQSHPQNIRCESCRENRILHAVIRPGRIEQPSVAKPGDGLPEPLSRQARESRITERTRVTQRTASTNPRRSKNGTCRSLNAQQREVSCRMRGSRYRGPPSPRQVETQARRISPDMERGTRHHLPVGSKLKRAPPATIMPISGRRFDDEPI